MILVGVMRKIIFWKDPWLQFSPSQAIALSFAAMIFVGTVLLALPIASQDRQSIGLLDAFFTAVSANCVTGLVVANTLTQWSLFGKVVILILIQLGGLGFFTVMTIGLIFLRRNISLERRILIQASFNQDNVGGMLRLTKNIIKITLLVESIGALLLSLGFYFSAPGKSLPQAVGMGVFHAVSAFCNAGFDIIGADSLVPYQGNYYINAVLIILIVSGGLGFVVFGDVIGLKKRSKEQKIPMRWVYLSLHSKLAVVSTAVLILLGMGLFLMFEWNNPGTLEPMNIPQKLQAALFQSVTLRTSGFAGIDQGSLNEPSQLISSVFMLIGGSPSGTAGGIKTVTISVVFCAMASVLRGRKQIEAFGRSIPLDLLQKALTVSVALVMLALLATIILHYTEMNSPFPHTILDLWFETTSAAGTVGLTTGITPYLSSAGKIVVALCMFVGRIGPITALVALHMHLNHSTQGMEYPKERVIMG